MSYVTSSYVICHIIISTVLCALQTVASLPRLITPHIRAHIRAHIKTHIRACAPQTAALLPHASTPHIRAHISVHIRAHIRAHIKTHFRACAPQTAAPLPHASTPVPPEREGGWEVGKTEGQRDGERVCVWCVCVCVCITHTNPGTRRLWHTRNNIVPPSTPLRLTSAGSVSSAGTAAELPARHACARWGASGVCVGGGGVWVEETQVKVVGRHIMDI